MMFLLVRIANLMSKGCSWLADAPWGARILKSQSDVCDSRQSDRPFAFLIWFMT